MPIFRGDELVGFSFTTAHVLDLGALSPGSAGIIDAMDAYAEGLQFIAIKLYERGNRNEQVWRLLEQNIRNPKLVVGDLEAQISTARLGARRFLELADRFGFENILSASEEMMNYSERMMRQAISRLPEGTYRAEGYFDGYQLSDDPGEKDLRIVVTVTINGDSMIVDLTGTSAQVDHRPFNMPFRGTVDQAIYTTIRSVLLDTALTEYVPQNEGMERPIQIVAPKGCMANPNFPAPTIGRFCPGNVLSATVMKALAPVAPRNISAGTGNIKVGAYSGTKNGDYWVYIDITEGSYGGRYGKDGMDAVDTLFTNTRNNPVEDIESHFPLRVNRYELVEDKAGAGQWRGGVGSIREVQFMSEAGLSVEGDGNKYRPWGIFGGGDGSVGVLQYVSASGGGIVELPSELPHRKGHPGDMYRFVSPCGGGYGDPLERDPELVLRDVLDEYVSPGNALSLYGVVINGDDWTIDRAATEATRAEIRSKRI
jgi:N-methylhydantoinase B